MNENDVPTGYCVCVIFAYIHPLTRQQNVCKLNSDFPPSLPPPTSFLSLFKSPRRYYLEMRERTQMEMLCSIYSLSRTSIMQPPQKKICLKAFSMILIPFIYPPSLKRSREYP
jgi:hypothetical protein